MWPNPNFPADLVTFAEEILNVKLHFFAVYWLDIQNFKYMISKIVSWDITPAKRISFDRETNFPKKQPTIFSFPNLLQNNHGGFLMDPLSERNIQTSIDYQLTTFMWEVALSFDSWYLCSVFV